MTLDQLLAREAIRKAIADYTVAGDARDPVLFNGLWATDAVFEFDGYPPLPSFRCEGIGEIHARSATWKPMSEPQPGMHAATFVRHNLTTCQIELTSSDTASARSYFIVMTDIGPDHCGTYTDRFVRTDQGWLFAHRHIRLDWRSSDGCFPPVKHS